MNADIETEEYLPYVKYLEKLKMIGAVDPWKMDDGSPAFALLVSVEIALAECNSWGNQQMKRSEFLSYLKAHNILVFSNIDEFVNWKKDKIKPSNDKPKFKRNISEERRKQLRNHASEIRGKIKPSTSEND